mmetsp:Transcript_19661/g.31214  ORF Transcript_19661/g.31214 Transcript_19661/m.31214 type:complete len:679 (+) Transcript_19661:78-2114(+)
MGFCESISDSWGVPPNNVNAIDFTCGLIEILSMPMIIYWIHVQSRKAREQSTATGDSEKAENAASNIIFPVFVKWLMAVALANLVHGLPNIFMPLDVGEGGSKLAAFVYPATWGFTHFVFEGLAVLLCQKGVGELASRAAIKWGVIFGVWTGAQLWPGFLYKPTPATITLGVSWEWILAIFYGTIWLAPQTWVFRRSAAMRYGRFWFILRFLQGLNRLLIGLDQDIGFCGYEIVNWIGFGLIKNWVIYQVLLDDSQWWQGTLFSLDRGHTTLTDPLLGIDLKLTTAQRLANQVDRITSNLRPKKSIFSERDSISDKKKSVNVLNFAYLKMDKKDLLGTGGTSKVYRGYYKGMPVAVKLVFVIDITIDVIQRCVSEARTLSQFADHPHVVQCYGVVVLPPCVAVVLELCENGSLYDVLGRFNAAGESGPNSNWNVRLSFCLGAAKGVQVLHMANICHRDLKSMNFLVDENMRVKIADLEGQEESENHDQLEETQHLECLNWVPPEALEGEGYEKCGDIYALGMVFWEVATGRVPWSQETNIIQLREKVIKGARPPIPAYAPDVLRDLIVRMVRPHPGQRPNINEVVHTLEAYLALQIQDEKEASCDGISSNFVLVQVNSQRANNNQSRTSLSGDQKSIEISFAPTSSQVASRKPTDETPYTSPQGTMTKHKMSVDRIST